MARKSRKNIAVSEAIPQMTTYTAAAYLRQSRDDGGKRGVSIETQRQIIENYLVTHPDMRLGKVYTDQGLTGQSFDRPGFRQMMADAENGLINCIIVKDLSRFGRNSIDTGYYIERVLPEMKVRLVAINDDFDSLDSDGGIMLPLKNLINEAYALDIGRKRKATHQQQICEGKFVGRLAPFGYCKDPADPYHLIVDPVAADIMRQIFLWAAEVDSVSSLVRRINDAKFLTPSRYKQSAGLITNSTQVGCALWTHRAVRDMLTDPVYIGDMAQGRTKTVSRKSLDIPCEDWIVVPNTHEAIVSRELFALVGERLKPGEAVKGKAYSENIFKGKIFCAHCGLAMTRKRQNKDNVYWFRCDTQTRYSHKACVQVSVKEEIIKEELAELLRQHAQVLLGSYAGLCRQAAPLMSGDADAALRKLAQKTAERQRFLGGLYENMADGLIDAAECKSMKSKYESELAALAEEADELRRQKVQMDLQLDAYHRVTGDALAAKSKFDLTVEHIDALVDKILVYPDKSIKICFKYRDEFQMESGVDLCKAM